MRRRIGMVGLAVAIALGGVVGAGGPAGADATHTITVTPSTFLSDGQTVTVTGTGYTEFGTIGNWTVAMCDGGFQSKPFEILTALQECDIHPEHIVTFIAADASGHISVTYPVRTNISTTTANIDCRTAPNGCVVLLAQVRTDKTFVGAMQPVTFGTPPPPPPQTIRDCAVTAWHDAKAGTPLRQVLRNFVRCVVKVLVARHH